MRDDKVQAAVGIIHDDMSKPRRCYPYTRRVRAGVMPMNECPEFWKKYALRAEELSRKSNHPSEPMESLVRRIEALLKKQTQEKKQSACP
ncbi:MAG: hypothetical protein KBC38_00910 [Candidatus Pacebacteria bacterium]|nr:hypothetical protein [Candidatus Paceibacterota bacterium]MBP9840199.1 hypothetical protein [Candidatus Paceibacterota bacterium]